MASTHTVESTTDTVRSGYLDPAAEPVATIAPGDAVRYPNTWTHWGNEAKFGMSFAGVRRRLLGRTPSPARARDQARTGASVTHWLAVSSRKQPRSPARPA